ncbi:MAG: nicotinamide mononucleotide adenylyltransferase [Glaciihabitans sp.]|nr:nicotinamide mononucleotide adenylyltransferase [Glaciihabitans sp.]
MRKPSDRPRFTHGLVLGKFYPLHSGHSNLIRTAVRQCESVTVEVLGATGESIPFEQRADWVREEHPTVRVASALDDAPVDYESASAWEDHVEVFIGLLDSPVDAVFSSDSYGAELARRLGAVWVQVDAGRLDNPISGTAVRADVERNWSELAPAARAWLTPRIVLLGAESTGTTTLAAALAAEYNTLWVPEYGRLYSEQRAGGVSATWSAPEFELIAQHQLQWERDAARRVPRPLLFCDTDILTTAIWQRHYAPDSVNTLWERAAAHQPALYILTADDIPFEEDVIRIDEAIRGEMHTTFRVALASQDVPWIEVSGLVAERIAQASAAINGVVRVARTVPTKTPTAR